MQRRDFLRNTAATGIALSLRSAGNFSGAAEPQETTPPVAVSSVLSIERLDTDHFRLVFRPAEPRSLRILQITDTHFGNPEAEHQERDARTFELLRRLLAAERPDLIAHTGDFINNDRGDKISFAAVEVLDSLGVPWTHALGNHDVGHVPTDEYYKLPRQALLGYFDRGGQRQRAARYDVVAGNEHPAFTLYAFDSGFEMPRKHVGPPQLEWFAEQLARDRKAELDCPQIALVHIPVREFEQLRASEQFSGIFGEQVCFESDEGVAFDAFRRCGRLRAVFSGHDHENDYCGLRDGVELVYGRVTGYSGYGDLPRGARLIELDPATGSYSHRLVFGV
ncbi:MAG: metallophosphoesterase family protein [Pirellulales bacterium]|nr:metallophosphoesterase family protein [Pirellulales bacterium]